MKSLNLTACSRLLEMLDRERVKLGLREGEECFYRGQSESTWTLDSSLLRHCRHIGRVTPQKIQKLESDLFYEFKRRAKDLHIQDWSGWDILFAMRHHGVATRLLDWTEVPAIALFFATYRLREGQTLCIWLLNPYRLNEYFDGDHDLVGAEYLGGDYEKFMVIPYPAFPWKKPVALYPIQRTGRLFAQQGYFTIQGHDLSPLDEQVPELVKRIDLPFEAVSNASDFLNAVGINEYSLFPDLDNLASYVNRKNGIGLPSPKLI